MKIWNYKYILALGTLIVAFVVVYFGFVNRGGVATPVSASWNGKITITAGGQPAIDYFCKGNPKENICKDDKYISEVIGNVYLLLQKYISDYASVTKIGQFYVMSPSEIKNFCASKTAIACWDFKDIAITYENFTYSSENKSYSTLAHEMLHAYATGSGFDLHPLEEGIVDSLAYEIPEMSVYKDIGYPEIRDIVHKLAEVYKKKGLEKKAIHIYIKMLREKASGLQKVLGFVTTKQVDVETCNFPLLPHLFTKPANEINNRLKCKFYERADDVVGYIKSDISETGGSIGLNEEGNEIDVSKIGALDTEFFPLEIKQGEQFTVKYSINDKSAKSAVVLLTYPNVEIDSKSAILSAIKSYGVEGSGKLQRMLSVICDNGVCEGEELFENGIGGKDQEIEVQAIALSSKTEVGNYPVTVDDILNVAMGKIKIMPEGADVVGSGNISITAMAKAATGDKINVSLDFANMEGQEFMLWITDCSGDYVPKISESDHELRAIKSNSFNYRYIWDTEKAGTDVCKHTIQVKTFLDGTMTETAKKDIEIVASGGDVCIVKITDIDVSVNNSDVTLAWDSICGASYYKVYRDGALIAKPSTNTITDTKLAPGTYEYTIEAWAGTPTAEPTVTPSPTHSLQDVPGNDNTNNDTSAFGIKKVFAFDDKTPISSKKVKTIVKSDGTGGKGDGGDTVDDPCKGKQNLGIPLPKIGGGTVTCVANIQEFFDVMYLYLAGVIALIAVLMIVYGGIKYISSQGDQTAITEAKSIIMGGLIGLAVVLLAGLFVLIFGQGQKM